MPTETVENYIKAVYSLCRESSTGEAAMSRVAMLVGVTTGTATTMVKKLAAAKLAKYERFGGVKLTAKGERAALDILRRHRLIETFLVDTLKLDWSVVHPEAERLEHAISPLVLEALDRHLNHPKVDPHGDPIPDARGNTRDPRGDSLPSMRIGARFRVVRITDQGADFLLFVAKHGLKPGARGAVLGMDRSAQAITVQADAHASVTMAHAAAQRILCDEV